MHRGFDWAAAALSLSQILRLILSGGVRCRGSLVMIYLDSDFVWFSHWQRAGPPRIILGGSIHHAWMSQQLSLCYRKSAEICQGLTTKTWCLSLVEKSLSVMSSVLMWDKVCVYTLIHNVVRYSCDRQNSRDLSNANILPRFCRMTA